MFLGQLLYVTLLFGTLSQEIGAGSQIGSFDVRARPNLLFGKGESSKADYWDVVITRQPRDGVLIKLPYTKKGGKLSFDVHHRVGMSPDFGSPAEITTVIEVLTGGTTSLGQYTIVDTVSPGDKFQENIQRSSNSEIDRYVTPMSRKTITLDIKPGPQSLSVVGHSVLISRGTTTTRIDTPGTRIAAISNIRFEIVNEVNPLKKSSGSN